MTIVTYHLGADYFTRAFASHEEALKDADRLRSKGWFVEITRS
jgi:hypothetical protein